MEVALDREGGFERRSASATADGLDKAIAMTEGPPISPHGGVETFVLALVTEIGIFWERVK